MAMIKKEKIAYVEKLKKEADGYKLVALMPMEGLPDRLFQKVRNQLKPKAKVIVARKNLLLKIVDNEKFKPIHDKITGNIALILSNEDPFEIDAIIKSNRLKLGAKPNQVAPAAIEIGAGETAIPPGQAVTELKMAGIDVKIDKGKVVIAKSKTLVEKGQKINKAVAKALKTLDITPFEASAKLAVAVSGKLVFTSDVFDINAAWSTKNISIAFNQANALTLEAGYVTQYNVERLVKKAYIGAMGVGLKAKVYEPGIVDKLLAEAVSQALALNAKS